MELLYRDFSDYNQWSIVLVNLIISDDQIWNQPIPNTIGSAVQVYWLEMGICEAIHIRFNQQNDYAPFCFTCFVHTIEVQCDSYPGRVEPKHHEPLLNYFKQLCIMKLIFCCSYSL